MKLVTVFCFLLVATIVAGQDTVNGCKDKVVEDVRDNPFTVCHYIEEYAKCIIRVSDLVNIDRAEDALKMLDSEINEKLKKGNYSCNIDVDELFKEAKFETAAQDAITDCKDKMVYDVRENSDVVCNHFEDYIKCVIRATEKMNIGVSEDAVQSLENQENEQLREDGFNCNIDMSELYEEVKAENAGSTTSPIGWLVVMVTSFLVML